MTKAERQAIEARANARAKAPRWWHVWKHEMRGSVNDKARAMAEGADTAEADATALLAELRRVEAQRDQAMALVEQAVPYICSLTWHDAVGALKDAMQAEMEAEKEERDDQG